MTASEWKNQLSHHDDEPASMAENVGRNVVRLRTAQKINKQTFSLMAGISRPFLNRVEKGKADLRLSYIQRIADALSITPNELLFGSFDDLGRLIR